ncbi:uncharacterized protein BCR38DRAFT_183671 [Pseudomassariella vexata]|uniref:Uncharacterized protein n=1 Tax=Pseudomassariella vexata TaxID=1141098 RepID=A0A1Y2E4U8_9PEZI|nr:uncharacterized protein BCR38DRAFT_183671 [Pseudomassariella vexata]ORY66593.1 hypothetical protein BCR38DRAFT_183671 [Pseudomassariella vexata]
MGNWPKRCNQHTGGVPGARNMSRELRVKHGNIARANLTGEENIPERSYSHLPYSPLIWHREKASYPDEQATRATHPLVRDSPSFRISIETASCPLDRSPSHQSIPKQLDHVYPLMLRSTLKRSPVENLASGRENISTMIEQETGDVGIAADDFQPRRLFEWRATDVPQRLRIHTSTRVGPYTIQYDHILPEWAHLPFAGVWFNNSKGVDMSGFVIFCKWDTPCM